MSEKLTPDQTWHALLNGEISWEKYRKRYAIFPAKHRCKNCNAPFDGIGVWFARWTGRGQFKRNPRFCDF